jgi:hypothetical protein
MADVRRVITGHDDAGRAVVTEDGAVAPLTLALVPGFESFELWSIDGAPVIPGELGRPGVPYYFPGDGGAVFRVVTFPPHAAATLGPDVDVAAALDEAQAKVPDLVARVEPDDPGMHTTDSLDFAVVIEGELDLELDEGSIVRVRAGDCVVQRATRHAWRNPTAAPARVAFILLGGRRDD